MKVKNKIGYFLSGIIFTLIFVVCLTPVWAAVSSKMIEVQTGVNIYVNDIKLNPKDANGNMVEPFIYNGTTYLPLRAVSEALDIPVQWDGKTNSVYLGRSSEITQYLMDVCPPYEVTEQSYQKIDTFVQMSGEKYTNGFIVEGAGGYAYFNLNGKYKTVSFDFGHVDNSYDATATMYIYLDGKLAKTYDLTYNALVKHDSIDVSGALQMQIDIRGERFFDYYNGSIIKYALANITVD